MTTATLSSARASGVWTSVWLNPVRLLVVAALFHIALTVAVYGIGNRALLPGTFDREDVALSAIPDGVLYRADAVVLSGWLLFSVATTAIVALGLVVVNIGALFRLRYAFMIWIIIIAAEGAAHMLEKPSGPAAEAQ